MKRFGSARGFSQVKRFPNFWPAETKRFQLGGLSTTTKNEALRFDGGVNNGAAAGPGPGGRFNLGRKEALRSGALLATKRFDFRLGSFALLLKRKRFRSGQLGSASLIFWAVGNEALQLNKGNASVRRGDS